MKEFYFGDTPDWVNLEKYKYLNGYCSKNICYEIEIRKLQLDRLKHPESIIIEDSVVCTFHIDLNEKEQILKTILLDATRLECLFKESINGLGEIVVGTENPDYDINKSTKLTLAYEQMYLSKSNILQNIFLDKNDDYQNPLQSHHIESHFFVPRKVLEIYEQALNEPSVYNNDKLDKKVLKEVVEEICLDYKEKDIPRKDYELMSNNFWFGFSLEAELVLLKELFLDTVFYKHLPEESKNFILTTIDISQPDEILIKNVLKIVNDKRKDNPELGLVTDIKEKNKKNGGIREIKTLIEQRVVQYLDLYIWNIENNQESTSDWYLNHLYKDKKEKDIIISHSKMNDSIKPAAKKWLSKFWVNSFYHLDIPSYDSIMNND